MDIRPAVTWTGTVADGRLEIGDWSAWRWGRMEAIELPDLASCFTVIEEGRCAGCMAPAAVLPLALSRALFDTASAWGDDAPGDDLDTALLQLLDHCAPLLEDPMIHWAVGRLRDISDAHLYLLRARELAARLFMEARRIQQELAQRESRLIAELGRQDSGGRTVGVLASDNACYGAGDPILAATLATPALAICRGPNGALLRSWQVPSERCCEAAEVGILAVCAYTIDDQQRAHVDPACAADIEAHVQAGGECWLLVSRFARGRPGHIVRDRAILPVDRFARLVTETRSTAQPVIDDDLVEYGEGSDVTSFG